MLKTLKKIVKYILQKIFFKFYAIETKEIQCGNSFLTIGSIKPSCRYKSVYLGHDCKVKNSIKIKANILSDLDKFHINYGIVNIQDSSLVKLNRNLFVLQPDFIVLDIPLPDTYAEYLNSITKDARNNLKKLHQYEYTSEISHDMDWVKTFYTDFYFPSMINRHFDDASLISKQKMSELSNHPGAEFVKLFLDGKCVAAALTIYTPGKYHFQKIGYYKGDISLLNKGIVNAMYLFRIQRAFELGCKKIVLGGTPPFLENGVFKYKAKWQARFFPDEYYIENYLLLNPSNKFCYNFLHSNSLIVFGLQNKLIVISGKKPEEANITSNILLDIKSWYILKKEYSENDSSEMEDLPVHLRHWYNKVF